MKPRKLFEAVWACRPRRIVDPYSPKQRARFEATLRDSWHHLARVAQQKD